jgi:hypothetical protein
MISGVLRAMSRPALPATRSIHRTRMEQRFRSEIKSNCVAILLVSSRSGGGAVFERRLESTRGPTSRQLRGPTGRQSVAAAVRSGLPAENSTVN